MNFPSNVKYTKDHEWIRIEGDFAYVGISDFAQRELGDIVFVDIAVLNQTIQQNASFGTVEAVKTVSELYLPVTGKVLEINEKLNSNPELVNSDPYGDGWMVKISIDDMSQYETILSDEQYKALIGV